MCARKHNLVHFKFLLHLEMATRMYAGLCALHTKIRGEVELLHIEKDDLFKAGFGKKTIFNLRMLASDE